MTEPGWYPDPLGGPGIRHWNGHDWDAAPAAEDYPEEHHQEKQSKTRLLVTVLVGLVGLMGGMLLMLLWPKSEPIESSVLTTAASPTVPPTTTPTGSSSESVAGTVRQSMQRDLDNDPELGKLGLKVVDVNLVHKSGNEYKGIATVETRDGVTHDVSVDVTADGAGVLWETPPGAFAFAQDETPRPAPRIPPPRLPPPAPAVVPPDSYENFTICPSGLTGVASEDTSCAFADNVRRAWYSNLGATTLSVYSPITRQEYTMRCVPATTTAWPNAKRCAGENAVGASLVVYIS